ncbi:hypothetical protein ACJJTC_001732 [Scirpophaga incertulas]
MEIDTGAAVSCISDKGYYEKFSTLILNNADIILRLYTGNSFKPLGYIQPLVTIGNFSKRYSDVFVEELGRFNGGNVRLNLRDGATPVFLRARPLPFALKEQVEREL